MNQTTVEKRFQECSLPIRLVGRHPRRFSPQGGEFFMDVEPVGNREERFRVFVKDGTRFDVLDGDSSLRHVLVLVETSSIKEKFLMGHDERHLFIAPLGTSNASTITEAFDQLKPKEVTDALKNGKKVHRQGEWFFVPVKSLPEDVKEYHIHKKEPILPRGGGNPHIAEELVRKPTKVTRTRLYSRFLGNDGVRVDYQYEIYARGKVRHGQHSTLDLRDWHQVFRNLEITSSENIWYGD